MQTLVYYGGSKTTLSLASKCAHRNRICNSVRFGQTSKRKSTSHPLGESLHTSDSRLGQIDEKPARPLAAAQLEHRLVCDPSVAYASCCSLESPVSLLFAGSVAL